MPIVVRIVDEVSLAHDAVGRDVHEKPFGPRIARDAHRVGPDLLARARLLHRLVRRAEQVAHFVGARRAGLEPADVLLGQALLDPDELAVAAKKDPVAYRRALLAQNPRAKAVLDFAAEKAQWGKALPQGVGRGVSLQFAFGTYMAQVAEVKVASDGAVRVQRVVCAVDCGVVVNPDTVRAQVESAIVFGIAGALYDEVTFKDGRVEQTNFHNYRVLRINETPIIDVDTGLPAVLAQETVTDYGAYGQILYGFRKGWVVGLRVDYVNGQEGDYEKMDLTVDGDTLGRDPEREERWRISPNLTWYPSEFSKLRLQYNYDDRREEGVDHIRVRGGTDPRRQCVESDVVLRCRGGGHERDPRRRTACR